MNKVKAKKAPKLVLKKKQPVKPTVKMIEYSIKMVIPTGQYANIQPEIKVMAQTPEEAHDYIAPHMNKIWKEYFMVNDRVNVEAPKPVSKPVAPAVNPVGPDTSGSAPIQTPAAPVIPVVESSPASNVAVIKAMQAINSCASLEALELIKNQVELSVKLAKEEKPALRDAIIMRFNELTADSMAKKGYSNGQ